MVMNNALYPQPSDAGIYDTSLAERFGYKDGRIGLTFYVLQVGQQDWVSSYELRIDRRERRYGLSRSTTVFSSASEAMHSQVVLAAVDVDALASGVADLEDNLNSLTSWINALPAESNTVFAEPG